MKKVLSLWKVVMLVVAGLIGVAGVTILSMYLAGKLGDNPVQPEDMTIEQVVDGKGFYNTTLNRFEVSDNFKMTISTTTEDVTEKTVELKLAGGTLKDGYVSDTRICVPQYVTLNVPFEVQLVSSYNREVKQAWINGGVSTLTAKSSNVMLEIQTTTIAVDVPVYQIKSNIVGFEDASDSTDEHKKQNVYVGSEFTIDTTFLPERGGQIYCDQAQTKNVFYKIMSSSIRYDYKTNKFSATKISKGDSITVYTFFNAYYQKTILDEFRNFSGEELTAKVLDKFAQLEAGTLDENGELQSVTAYKSYTIYVDVLDISVEKVNFKNLNTLSARVDKIFTISTNSKTLTDATIEASIEDSAGNSLKDMFGKIAIKLPKNSGVATGEDVWKNLDIWGGKYLKVTKSTVGNVTTYAKEYIDSFSNITDADKTNPDVSIYVFPNTTPSNPDHFYWNIVASMELTEQLYFNFFYEDNDGNIQAFFDFEGDLYYNGTRILTKEKDGFYWSATKVCAIKQNAKFSVQSDGIYYGEDKIFSRSGSMFVYGGNNVCEYVDGASLEQRTTEKSLTLRAVENSDQGPSWSNTPINMTINYENGSAVESSVELASLLNPSKADDTYHTIRYFLLVDKIKGDGPVETDLTNFFKCKAGVNYDYFEISLINPDTAKSDLTLFELESSKLTATKSFSGRAKVIAVTIKTTPNRYSTAGVPVLDAQGRYIIEKVTTAKDVAVDSTLSIDNMTPTFSIEGVEGKDYIKKDDGEIYLSSIQRVAGTGRKNNLLKFNLEIKSEDLDGDETKVINGFNSDNIKVICVDESGKEPIEPYVTLVNKAPTVVDGGKDIANHTLTFTALFEINENAFTRNNNDIDNLGRYLTFKLIYNDGNSTHEKVLSLIEEGAPSAITGVNIYYAQPQKFESANETLAKDMFEKEITDPVKVQNKSGEFSIKWDAAKNFSKTESATETKKQIIEEFNKLLKLKLIDQMGLAFGDGVETYGTIIEELGTSTGDYILGLDETKTNITNFASTKGKTVTTSIRICVVKRTESNSICYKFDDAGKILYETDGETPQRLQTVEIKFEISSDGISKIEKVEENFNPASGVADLSYVDNNNIGSATVGTYVTSGDTINLKNLIKLYSPSDVANAIESTKYDFYIDENYFSSMTDNTKTDLGKIINIEATTNDGATAWFGNVAGGEDLKYVSGLPIKSIKILTPFKQDYQMKFVIRDTSDIYEIEFILNLKSDLEIVPQFESFYEDYSKYLLTDGNADAVFAKMSYELDKYLELRSVSKTNGVSRGGRYTEYSWQGHAKLGDLIDTSVVSLDDSVAKWSLKIEDVYSYKRVDITIYYAADTSYAQSSFATSRTFSLYLNPNFAIQQKNKDVDLSKMTSSGMNVSANYNIYRMIGDATRMGFIDNGYSFDGLTTVPVSNLSYENTESIAKNIILKIDSDKIYIVNQSDKVHFTQDGILQSFAIKYKDDEYFDAPIIYVENGEMKVAFPTKVIESQIVKFKTFYEFVAKFGADLTSLFDEKNDVRTVIYNGKEYVVLLAGKEYKLTKTIDDSALVDNQCVGGQMYKTDSQTITVRNLSSFISVYGYDSNTTGNSFDVVSEILGQGADKLNATITVDVLLSKLGDLIVRYSNDYADLADLLADASALREKGIEQILEAGNVYDILNNQAPYVYTKDMSVKTGKTYYTLSAGKYSNYTISATDNPNALGLYELNSVYKAVVDKDDLIIGNYYYKAESESGVIQRFVLQKMTDARKSAFATGMYYTIDNLGFFYDSTLATDIRCDYQIESMTVSDLAEIVDGRLKINYYSGVDAEIVLKCTIKLHQNKDFSWYYRIIVKSNFKTGSTVYPIAEDVEHLNRKFSNFTDLTINSGEEGEQSAKGYEIDFNEVLNFSNSKRSNTYRFLNPTKLDDSAFDASELKFKYQISQVFVDYEEKKENEWATYFSYDRTNFENGKFDIILNDNDLKLTIVVCQKSIYSPADGEKYSMIGSELYYTMKFNQGREYEVKITENPGTASERTLESVNNIFETTIIAGSGEMTYDIELNISSNGTQTPVTNFDVFARETKGSDSLDKSLKVVMTLSKGLEYYTSADGSTKASLSQITVSKDWYDASVLSYSNMAAVGLGLGKIEMSFDIAGVTYKTSINEGKNVSIEINGRMFVQFENTANPDDKIFIGIGAFASEVSYGYVKDDILHINPVDSVEKDERFDVFICTNEEIAFKIEVTLASYVDAKLNSSISLAGGKKYSFVTEYKLTSDSEVAQDKSYYKFDSTLLTYGLVDSSTISNPSADGLYEKTSDGIFDYVGFKKAMTGLSVEKINLASIETYQKTIDTKVINGKTYYAYGYKENATATNPSESGLYEFTTNGMTLTADAENVEGKTYYEKVDTEHVGLKNVPDSIDPSTFDLYEDVSSLFDVDVDAKTIEFAHLAQDKPFKFNATITTTDGTNSQTYSFDVTLNVSKSWDLGESRSATYDTDLPYLRRTTDTKVGVSSTYYRLSEKTTASAGDPISGFEEVTLDKDANPYKLGLYQMFSDKAVLAGSEINVDINKIKDVIDKEFNSTIYSYKFIETDDYTVSGDYKTATIQTENVGENTQYYKMLSVGYFKDTILLHSFEVTYNYLVVPNVLVESNYSNPTGASEIDGNYLTDYINVVEELNTTKYDDLMSSDIKNGYFTSAPDFSTRFEKDHNRIEVFATSIAGTCADVKYSVSVASISKNAVVYLVDGSGNVIKSIKDTNSDKIVANAVDRGGFAGLNLKFGLTDTSKDGEVVFEIKVNNVVLLYTTKITTSNLVKATQHSPNYVGNAETVYAEDLAGYKDQTLFAENRILNYKPKASAAAGTYYVVYRSSTGFETTRKITTNGLNQSVNIDLGESLLNYTLGGVYRDEDCTYDASADFDVLPNLTSRITLSYVDGRSITMDYSKLIFDSYYTDVELKADAGTGYVANTEYYVVAEIKGSKYEFVMKKDSVANFKVDEILSDTSEISSKVYKEKNNGSYYGEVTDVLKIGTTVTSKVFVDNKNANELTLDTNFYPDAVELKIKYDSFNVNTTYRVKLALEFEVLGNADSATTYTTAEIKAGEKKLLLSFDEFAITNTRTNTLYTQEMLKNSKGKIALDIYGIGRAIIDSGDDLQKSAHKLHTNLTTVAQPNGVKYYTGLIPTYDGVLSGGLVENNIANNYIRITAPLEGGDAYDYTISAIGSNNDGNHVMMLLTYSVTVGSKTLQSRHNILFKVVPNSTINFKTSQTDVAGTAGESIIDLDGKSYQSNESEPFRFTSGTAENTFIVKDILQTFMYGSTLNSVDEDFLKDLSTVVIDPAGLTITSSTEGKTFKIEKLLLGEQYYLVTMTNAFGYTIKFNIKESADVNPQLTLSSNTLTEGETLAFGVEMQRIEIPTIKDGTTYYLDYGTIAYNDAKDGAMLKINDYDGSEKIPGVKFVWSFGGVDFVYTPSSVSESPIQINTGSAVWSYKKTDTWASLPEKVKNALESAFGIKETTDETKVNIFDGTITDSSTTQINVYIGVGMLDEGAGNLTTTIDAYSFDYSVSYGKMQTVGTDTNYVEIAKLVPAYNFAISTENPTFTSGSSSADKYGVISAMNNYTFVKNTEGYHYLDKTILDNRNAFTHLQNSAKISSVMFYYDDALIGGTTADKALVTKLPGKENYYYNGTEAYKGKEYKPSTMNFTIPNMGSYYYGTANQIDNVRMEVLFTNTSGEQCTLVQYVTIQKKPAELFNEVIADGNSIALKNNSATDKIYGTGGSTNPTIYNDTLMVELPANSQTTFVIDDNNQSKTTLALVDNSLVVNIDDATLARNAVTLTNTNSYAVRRYVGISEHIENLRYKQTGGNYYDWLNTDADRKFTLYVTEKTDGVTFNYNNSAIALTESTFGTENQYKGYTSGATTIASGVTTNDEAFKQNIESVNELNSSGQTSRKLYFLYKYDSKVYRYEQTFTIKPQFISASASGVVGQPNTIVAEDYITMSNGTKKYYIAPNTNNTSRVSWTDFVDLVHPTESGSSRLSSKSAYMFTFERGAEGTSATIDENGTIVTKTDFEIGSHYVNVNLYAKVSGYDGNFEEESTDSRLRLGSFVVMLANSHIHTELNDKIDKSADSANYSYVYKNNLITVGGGYTATGIENGEYSTISTFYDSSLLLTFSAGEKIDFKTLFKDVDNIKNYIKTNINYHIISYGNEMVIGENRNSFTFSKAGIYKCIIVVSGRDGRGNMVYKQFSTTITITDSEVGVETKSFVLKATEKTLGEGDMEITVDAVGDVYEISGGNTLKHLEDKKFITYSVGKLDKEFILVGSDGKITRLKYTYYISLNDLATAEKKIVGIRSQSTFDLKTLFGDKVTVYRITNNNKNMGEATVEECTSEFFEKADNYTETITYFVTGNGRDSKIYNVTYKIIPESVTDVNMTIQKETAGDYVAIGSVDTKVKNYFESLLGKTYQTSGNIEINSKPENYFTIFNCVEKDGRLTGELTDIDMSATKKIEDVRFVRYYLVQTGNKDNIKLTRYKFTFIRYQQELTLVKDITPSISYDLTNLNADVLKATLGEGASAEVRYFDLATGQELTRMNIEENKTVDLLVLVDDQYYKITLVASVS